MMHDDSYREPADYVIWATSAMLALLVGMAVAFLLWVGLHRVTESGMALAAVGTLGAGTVLVGLSLDRPLVRVFLVVMAAVFVLGYTLGGPAFSHLVA
ncbi:MAG TPA: hypothetical protein VFE36_10500 [Candidatus Baltobacteraceae bacterium]|jgi:hypothetical protein|nr:hypothetical protein [Candidatus Baltobacteraceae bacterium]